MAKVHFVKKSRKEYVDNLTGETIKAGESYYWWAFRYQPKQISKTPPKSSRLTQSEFLQAVYRIQEEIDVLTAADTIIDQLDNIKNEIKSLKEETEDKIGNIPDNLQRGSTTKLLQSRVDSLQGWFDKFDNIDTEIDKELSKEEKEKRYQEILEDVQSHLFEGE